jgi:hypothetical protein
MKLARGTEPSLSFITNCSQGATPRPQSSCASVNSTRHSRFAARLAWPPAAFPRRRYFHGQKICGRCPAGCAANIVLFEKSWPTRVSIASRWESEADYSPNCHASTPISSRPGRNCARVAPNWDLGAASLEVTSPRNIVPPRKPHRLLCEISYPDLIVPPGKRYRPCEETLSSCPGTNIVLPRNLHRPLREPISSPRGKVIVPLRKCT